MRKKLMIVFSVLLPSVIGVHLVHAALGPNALRVDSRDPTNSFTVANFITPLSNNEHGIVYQNGTTKVPDLLHIGSGLTFSGTDTLAVSNVPQASVSGLVSALSALSATDTSLLSSINGKEPLIVSGTNTNQYWSGLKTWETLPITTTSWGTILGTLSDQSDLNSVLNGKLVKASNLSDLSSSSTARTNLGLGSLAILSSVNNSNWSGTSLSLANGGTGSTTAADAINALLPTQSGNSGKVLSTNGSSPTWVSTTTLQVRNQSSVTRSLDTCFQVSSTRDSMVNYSVEIVSTLSLSGGQSGTVFLEIYNDSGCSTGTQELARLTNGNTGALTIGLNTVQTQAGNLPGYIPLGKWAKLRSLSNTGTPTFTYRSGQEVQL